MTMYDPHPRSPFSSLVRGESPEMATPSEHDPVSSSSPAASSLPIAATELPNLLLVGAMKASTTTLYRVLARHPEIWFPDEKEPHYFTADDYGTPAAARRYREAYANSPDGIRWRGDGSTGYTKCPRLGPTPQRIERDLGRPEMIYVLRDPVERLISNFHHNHATGAYPRGMTLAHAIEVDPIIVTASRYDAQICEYESVFGENCLMLVLTNELHEDPVSTLQVIADRLGISVCEAWKEQLPASNSWQRLGKGNRLKRLVPSSWQPGLGTIKRIVPDQVKRSVTDWMPAVHAPEVTVKEQMVAHEILEDDIRQLVQRLGKRISGWPAVKRITRSAL